MSLFFRSLLPRFFVSFLERTSFQQCERRMLFGEAQGKTKQFFQPIFFALSSVVLNGFLPGLILVSVSL